MPGRRRAYAERDRFDPGEDLDLLRTVGPLTRMGADRSRAGRSIWLATGYDVVREVLGDHRRFSTRDRYGFRRATDLDGRTRPEELVGNLMDYDPPDHTRLRRMLAAAFTVRRMQAFAPRIERIVAERLDAIAAAGPPADLITEFAWPIPVTVLSELIGVPRDDRGEFARRAHLRLDFGRSSEERAVAATVLRKYLSALVTRHRQDPGQDMIGMLVRQHGDELDDDMLTGICILLVLAALDNVSGMLGLGALLLIEHPDQLAALRERPEIINDAVDEMMRYLSVVHAPTLRVAMADVTVAGQSISQGDGVICSIPSANRDRAGIEEPDRFDLTRPPGPHVAFGHGIHHCLGAPLARLEMRISYLNLIRRFGDLRLAIPSEAVRFRTESPAYGVESLPVTW